MVTPGKDQQNAAIARPNGIASQALRFAVVGVCNTAICLIIIGLARLLPGVPVWLASAIGYAVATVQSYMLNRSWTFGGGGSAIPVAAQFPRFIVVNMMLGLVFSVLNEALAREFALIVSTLLTLAVVVPASFVMMRILVFRRRPE